MHESKVANTTTQKMGDFQLDAPVVGPYVEE